MGEERNKPQPKPGNCELCSKAWQPENYGSPRKCAFEGETFSGENWNCGLVDAIRSEMYDNEDEQYAMRIRFDDQSFAALFVAIPEVDETFWGPGYSLMGLLVASWYKDRGRCDELKWGICDRGVSGEELTRGEAVKIVADLKARQEREEAPPVESKPPERAFTGTPPSAFQKFVSSAHLVPEQPRNRAERRHGRKS